MATTKSKTIVIGGAEGALGSAALKHFASLGHTVYGTTFSEQSASQLNNLMETQKWKGRATQVDLSSSLQCLEFAATVLGKNQVVLVFNAAGGFRYTSVDGCSDEDFTFLLNANYISCWQLTKAFLPAMKKNNSGRLVFVSSRKTRESGQANFGIYTASKAALDAMVAGLADELKASAITVNLVAPTTIDTPANRAAMPDAPHDKWVTTTDILKAIEFLTSDDAKAVNGATLTLAGGL